MSLNSRCPRCGSENTQLSAETRTRGCLWLIAFGWYYVAFVALKWFVGVMLFLFIDWWLAIIFACIRRPYRWTCRRFFTGRRRYYFCHNCGHNYMV